MAREAGVSLATASRALRGEACVREEMAERVRRAAMEMGYARRVQLGAGTRVRKRALILTPAPEAPSQAAPELLEGIALTLRGAWLDPVFAEDAAEVRSPAPRGAIIVDVTDRTKRAGLNPHARVVNVGHAPDGKSDAVVADDLGGMHGLVSDALALGHRRVAVVTGPPEHSSSQARKRAVVAALEEAEIPRSKVVWREAGWSVDHGYEAGIGLLASRREPTLIVCCHDLQALGVLRAARERGMRVPHDLSVTGFGGHAAGPGFRLRITSARVDPYAMGVVAAERLAELLRKPSGPPRTIVLPAARVPGQTLAAPRRR